MLWLCQRLDPSLRRRLGDYRPRMDAMLLKIYQDQVKNQCEFTLMAARDINAALSAQNDALKMLSDSDPTCAEWRQAKQVTEATADRIWYSLNAFLNAVANVSKLLWPRRDRKTATDFPNRGEELRESLGVPDDSSLKHRTVRNHFEHLDERYETWWLDSERHIIVSRIMGPLREAVVGPDTKDLFEQFDHAKLIVAFQGDLFELQPIADEISDLLEAARRAEASSWPSSLSRPG
jgi:hypothetical protein